MRNIGGLVAGTLVHTDKGLVPIEQLKVGDMVLSKLENGHGKQVYKPVVRTIATENVGVRLVTCVLKDILDDVSRKFVKPIKYEELTNIVVTIDQPFWVVGKGWIQAGDIQGHDLFELSDGRLAVVYKGGAFTAAKPIYHIPGNIRGWTVYNDEYNDDEAVYYEDFDLTPDVMRQRDIGEPYFDRYLGWHKDHNQRYTCTVYNFEVADTHTYYVGDIGVRIHDTNCN